MDKKSLRVQVQDHLESLHDREIQSRSLQACRHFLHQEEFKSAQSVMFFLSLPKEVETSHAILLAFEADKTVLVPRVHWAQRQMEPVVIHALNCPMEIGRHGLRNPTGSETRPVSQIDLIVIPGVAFDRSGNRIGHGAGFYDRFLADQHFQGLRCGLALEDQVIDVIPTESHDMKLDMLVTDKRARRFNNRQVPQV